MHNLFLIFLNSKRCAIDEIALTVDFVTTSTYDIVNLPIESWYCLLLYLPRSIQIAFLFNYKLPYFLN